MRITNSDKSVQFASHVINSQIVAVKLPNLGTGKSWKTKKGKIAGQVVEFMYNEARPTGVYWKDADGNVNYVRERSILEQGALQIVVKEPKPKPEKAEKPAKEAKAKSNGKAKGKAAAAGGETEQDPAQPEAGDTGAA